MVKEIIEKIMVNEEKNRTLVIGLDGATWRILQQFLDEQRMPNLQNLIDNVTGGGIYESCLHRMQSYTWRTNG